MSERSVPGFTLFLGAVGTKERIGVFAYGLETVTVEVTLTTYTLDLLHEMVVTRPLFLDELPQLGILGGEAVALVDGGIQSGGDGVAVVGQEAFDSEWLCGRHCRVGVGMAGAIERGWGRK